MSVLCAIVLSISSHHAISCREIRSVRQRLLLLVIAALLPLLVVIGTLSFMSVSEKQADLRDTAVGHATDILRSADRELAAQKNLVAVLARSPSLEGATLDLERFYEVARRFVAQVDGWDRIILAQAERGQILNTGLPFGASLPGIVDSQGFDQALKSDGVIVTNLTGPGPSSAQGSAVVALRQRINRPDGRTIVLSVTVRAELFERVIRQARVEPNWRPFLIDGADRIISAPRAVSAIGHRASQPAIDARLSGASGVYPGRAWNGEPVVTAFIKSAQTNWSAHISIPEAEYNEPLRRSIAIIAALTLLALLLFGVFAYVARRELVATRTETEALSRAARMEALGRMTGGVAHDFNNLLMVVTTAAEMLSKRNLDKSSERFLTAIKSAADRGAMLTRQLTMFARGQGGEVATVDVGLRLVGIKSMLQQSVTDEIPVEFQLPNEPLFIKVDPVQFDLALVNIVSNARDAMPTGGAITVSLQPVTYPAPAGRGMRLSITDTGSGISSKDLPHVFEPFYTTKEVGKGSGLGLSHVYGFAQAHGGTATISSEPGRGATISLFFPAVDEPDLPVGELAPINAAWRGDGLEAIVVDDNDDVRILTGEVLEDIGFHVRYASNASEAMARCEAGSDLLVSDIVMPGAMNGVGLALLVRQRWPDMQTLLMTGYSEASSEARSAGLRVIRKPFTRAMLLGAINTERLETSRRFGRTRA